MAAASKKSKNNLAPTPANVCRIPIFAPTRRPIGRKTWVVKNSWGQAVIEGKLGQQHRDLLDATIMVAEQEEWIADQDGDQRLNLMVDFARLRSTLGWDAITYAQIEANLKDLMKALVTAEIYASSMGEITGQIVAEYAKARENGNPHGKVLYPVRSSRMAGVQPKPYMRITFGKFWSRLIQDDQLTRYPLRAVVQLRFGFSQAVARYCLSHRGVNEDIADLAVRLDATRQMSKLRHELEEDADGLMNLGIAVNDGRVKFTAGGA